MAPPLYMSRKQGVYMSTTQGKNTYFYTKEGTRLARDEGILPITLFEGMKITIQGYDTTFEVVDWQYHHGQDDEEAGLKIILKEVQASQPRTLRQSKRQLYGNRQ